MQPSDLEQEANVVHSPLVRRSVGRSSCHHAHDLYFRTFCGLCFFQNGFAWEIPKRLHQYKTLAENGNPQADDKFIAHLQVIFGIQPPKPGQSLHQFREERKKHSAPAPSLYPIASIIWEMMGYQPPLAYPFYLSVVGMPTVSISYQLGISQYNLALRLNKATRYAMRLYYGRYSTIQKAASQISLQEPAAKQRGSEQNPDGARGFAHH